MILYAVYIIMKDGRELVSEIFQSPKNIPNNSILTALLAAFQGMSESLTKQEGGAEKLNLSGLVYHVQFFGDFQVVIVTDGDNRPAKVLDMLGWRFLQQHGELVEDWKGNQSMFEPFRHTIQEVVSKHIDFDISRSIDPTKSLNTAAIYSMPKNMQSTALAIIGLEYATFEELLNELECDKEELENTITYLREQGYVGIRERDDELQYFAVI